MSDFNINDSKATQESSGKKKSSEKYEQTSLETTGIVDQLNVEMLQGVERFDEEKVEAKRKRVIDAEDIAFKIYRKDTTRSSNDRRIVITGIGVISPNGIGKKEFWKNTKNGISGIKKISLFDTTSLPIQIAGEISNFEPLDFFLKKRLRYLDRFSQFSVVASKEAVSDAKINPSEIDEDRISIFQGTAAGGIPGCETQSRIFFTKGLEKIHPLFSTRWFPGAGVSNIAIDLECHGETHTISSGCTSSTDAIGLAYRELKRGNIDYAIAGGVDAAISPLAVNCFDRIKIMSKKNNSNPSAACRPFDTTRDGLVVSEGGCMFIMENIDTALKRNAEIYCEIVGFGVSHDAYHIAEPSPSTRFFENAMKKAMLEAEISLEDIEVVFAHGNSTIIGDIHETHSIKNVFKNHAKSLLVPALESMIGHPFGAVGALKLCAAALSVNNQFVFPTINLYKNDKNCDLDYVPNTGRDKAINYALVNSSSFGGKYSVLAIKKIDAK